MNEEIHGYDEKYEDRSDEDESWEESSRARKYWRYDDETREERSEDSTPHYEGMWIETRDVDTEKWDHTRDDPDTIFILFYRDIRLTRIC